MNLIIDFIVHIDKYINIIIQKFGILTYAILFLIIFLETGLLVTPFLPGDSLLFVVGTFAALGSLNVVLIFFLLSLAAILGDSFNYFLGSYFGERFFYEKGWIKIENLNRTKEFFRKYGSKTIVIARFLPVVRTVAPFIAGVGKMDYLRFLIYNVLGGIAWVALFLFAGFFFGNISFIKENLSLVIIAIIILSFTPAIVQYIRHKIK
ncbi:VTT domain-containing protein [Candidatus Pacearchaeota archaeon]|nr:VTT domain-containing protein [Candidatus Pacearchaeota archaeon]